MKEIPLTQEQVAIVDDEDYERVTQYKWYAQWSPNVQSFYARRTACIAGRHVYVWMHRFIMDAKPGEVTDHRNGDTLDCRRSNMRICSYRDNACNRRRHKQFSSIYKGVTYHKATGKWQAAIKHLGRVVHLGLYEAQEEAALAYDTAARARHGEFALTNFEET